jgi:TPR repeat protein
MEVENAEAQRFEALCAEDQGKAFELAVVYEQDPNRSRTFVHQCFLRLMTLGHPGATNRCGVYFENGTGCDVNTGVAVSCYIQAAKKGDGDAWANLGRCIEAETLSRGPKGETAPECYKKAAEKDSALGCLKYGHYLIEEINAGRLKRSFWGKSPYITGIEYIKIAADKGNPEAQWRWGLFSEFEREAKVPIGEGRFRYIKVKEEARESYERSATQGDAIGNFLLGHCLAQGVGGYRDLERARTCFERARQERDRVIRELSRYSQLLPCINSVMFPRGTSH